MATHLQQYFQDYWILISLTISLCLVGKTISLFPAKNKLTIEALTVQLLHVYQ